MDECGSDLEVDWRCRMYSDIASLELALGWCGGGGFCGGWMNVVLSRRLAGVVECAVTLPLSLIHI